MQTPNDVELGYRFTVAGSGCLPGLLERHSVCAVATLLASESAQPAGGNAYVRRIDVTIYVEVSDVAVKLFANEVGHPTHGENIVRAIESKPIGDLKPLAREHLLGDGREAGVVGLEGSLRGNRYWRERGGRCGHHCL